MSDNKDLQSLIKKVDLSDLKVLVIGIVLLIIPIIFLVFNFSRSGKKDLSSTARDRLGMHKSAFSFKRTASEHPAGRTAPAPAVKAVPPEKEWAAAFERISTAKAYIPPQIAALPKNARKYSEAEMNTAIRTSNVLIKQGRFDEAKAICDTILKTESENEFLRFMASGNLCNIYDSTGDIASLRKEFLRYLDLLESLKIKGFAAANVKAGYLAMNKMLLDFDKIRSDPGVRAHVGDVLAKHQRDGNVSVDQVLDETLSYLRNFPSDKK
jgi:hypothetical protein